jgi:hypothetical protein
MTYRVKAHYFSRADGKMEKFDALSEAFVGSAQVSSPHLILMPVLKR